MMGTFMMETAATLFASQNEALSVVEELLRLQICVLRYAGTEFTLACFSATMVRFKRI